MSEGKLLLSRRETAQLLGLSTTAISLLAQDGRLTPTHIGGRTLFHRDVVNEFAKTGTKQNIRAAK